jgi:hypothetical protein
MAEAARGAGAIDARRCFSYFSHPHLAALGVRALFRTAPNRAAAPVPASTRGAPRMAKPSAILKRRETTRAGGALLAACCSIAPWLAGCRAVDNAQVDVLERELRQQEDYIYELEDYLIEYSEKLRQCRMACQAPMEISRSTDDGAAATGEPTLADDRPRTQSQRPAGRGGAGPLVVPPDEGPANPLPGPGPEADPVGEPAAPPTDPAEMEAPELDLGPTSDLQWQDTTPVVTTPAPEAVEAVEEAPLYMPDPADYQLDVGSTAEAGAPVHTDVAPLDEALSLTPPELTPASPELPPPVDASRLVATKLQIRRLFAEPPAPEAAPDVPAAGSLLVVVEALNATDEPVDAGGEISLMVMAGEAPQALERVDRWDFTAEETQASWQSSQLGDGLHLELPLGQGPLPEGPLELWARVVNADGAKLLARLPFAAHELTSMADAPPETMASVVEQTSLTADGAPVESLNETDVEATPPTAWRASSEPLDPARVEAFATTTAGQGSQWTSQPPGGRAPLAGEPRVAERASGPPRWQQGTTPAPGAAGESSNAWAPFR